MNPPTSVNVPPSAFVTVTSFVLVRLLVSTVTVICVVLFTTRPGELPESYMRYLANGIREDFKMPGVPLRFSLRKTKNPYAGE